jgi:hypothetical protein
MHSKIRVLIPSLGGTLFLAIFLTLSFNSGLPLLADGDTGFHIRVGEFILDTHSVPKHDIFSFLTPPLPWIAHEWLSEVVMALLHRAFGLTGVVLFFIFLISLTFCLLFRVLRTYKGDILADTILLPLVMVSSYLHFLARPHIFSLLLTVVWYFLLDAFRRDGRNGYVYLLPPLMLLWVNLHGGFVVGFLLAGVFLAGMGWEYHFSDGREKERSGKKTKVLGFVILACILVSLVNPYGYHLLLFPFKLVSKKYIIDHVDEFLSPDFHRILPFKYLLFLMITVFAVSPKKLEMTELVLVLLFSGMALYSYRYIPLYCVIIAPILSRQAFFLLDRAKGEVAHKWKIRSGRIADMDSSVRGHWLPVAAVLLVVFCAGTGKLEYRFDGKIKPVAAVKFLKMENLRGNMFNNDEFGDYLIYAASPPYKVFIDGRLDMYDTEKVKEYRKVAEVGSGWETIIEKYGIAWIFFNADSVLSRFLQEKEEWHLIYADRVAHIFVKKIPENQALINKYRDIKPVIEVGNEKGS